MCLNIKKLVFGLLLITGHTVAYAQEWQYEVKPGDSLWSIAEEYMIAEEFYLDLQAFNNVEYPRRMQPGRIIRAPVEWLGNFPGTASVVNVAGTVELARDNARNKLEVGEQLGNGDELFTGENGMVMVKFSDGSIMRVFADTRLKFNSLKQSYDGSVIKARMVIESGRAEVESNPEKRRGHRMEIETPAAVTAVRGTEFRVGVEQGTGDTSSEVIYGKVGVSGSGQTVIVNRNQGTATQVNMPPIKPVELLPPPKIIYPGVIEKSRGGLQWQRMTNADAYRVRESDDKEFDDVIYDHLVAGVSVDDIVFPEDGDFYLSVRAIDEHDIEGLDSIVKVIVNARPEPPLIILPGEDAIIFDMRPKFSWTLPVSDASKMHFQLSGDKEFKTVLVDLTLDITDHLVLDRDLEPGEYYWRVANIDSEGPGPVSAPMRFTIKAQPEIVPEYLDSDSGRAVKIRLVRDPGITRYHVQVARDKAFNKLVFDQWVDEEFFSFRTKTAGAYFIRLGIEDQHSNTINYMDTQKVLVPYKGWKEALWIPLTGLIFAL